MPEEPGTYTPIVFSTGFAGVVPPILYEGFENRLAEKGKVVITLFSVKMPNYPVMADAFGIGLEWLKENSDNKIADHGYKGI